MKESDRYVKIVEWSEEDDCYVGTCPGLFLGGVHGDEEIKVYADLCELADEVVEMLLKDGKPLPPPTNKNYSGKFMLRVDADLHRLAALRALQAGKSLNSYCESVLAEALHVSEPATHYNFRGKPGNPRPTFRGSAERARSGKPRAEKKAHRPKSKP